MPKVEFCESLNLITGLKNVDPVRFKLSCSICASGTLMLTQDKGACIQCAEKTCLKAFHPECARRYQVYLGYNYQHYPYWRVYCDSHNETQTVAYRCNQYAQQVSGRILKFTSKL